MGSKFLQALRPSVIGSAIGWTLDAGYFLTFQGRIGGNWQSLALVDAAAIAIDCTTDNFFTLTKAANGAAVIAAPTNLPANSSFRIKITNTSGGAITNTTFAATYKNPGSFPFAATANNRTYEWWWDGTNAWFVSQSAIDVAN